MAIRVSVLGHGFIAKAHAHAYLTAPEFYEMKKPELELVYGRDEKSLSDFARRFGFSAYSTDLSRSISEGDVVDNCLPNHLHATPTLEALEKGKHVVLEKPMALSVKDAEEMVLAANKAGVKAAIGFNYRFLPAISLAKKLIGEGRIGKVHEFRGAYLQEYLSNPNIPVAQSGVLIGWRQRKELAGSGSLGDLGSHLIDMARYLVGEIREVVAQEQILYPERPTETGEKIRVEVDDAFSSLVKFDGGATGVIEASRVAPGMKNQQRIEVHGNKGSIAFNLERPNELSVYLEDEPSTAGFRTIIADDPHWWPAGHVLGWEHSVVMEIAQFLRAVENDEPLYPMASFQDGLSVQKVLDTIERSARSGRWETVRRSRDDCE